MKILVIMAVIIFWAPISMACDCGFLSLDQRLNLSDSVFLGEVVAHESKLENWGGSDVIQFKLVEKFKGNYGNIIVATGQSMCDYFSPGVGKPGERYLVFLEVIEGKPVISACMGTLPENEASEDLKQLRSRNK